jgi:hypothetical protein
VHGTAQEVTKAKDIIEGTDTINVGLHSINSVELATT